MKKFFLKGMLEAGCDEAGRGPLAGPVFAAAVILPSNFYHPLLNDSKQVLEKDRNTLRKVIEKKAIDYGVAMVDNDEIDRINILKASLKAMHAALDKLGKKKPELLLVDGNCFNTYQNIPHKCIIGGDALYACIAAASILAKTYRDEFMLQLHEDFPHYGWNTNKGYGTEEHRSAIGKYGLCKFHRKTFHVSIPKKELF